MGANLTERRYIRPMDNLILDSDADVIGRHGPIKLHGPAGFAGMRAAGRCAAEILDALVPHVVPGVTTGEIDEIVFAEMRARGAIPATLGYRGYTKSCCTSINHVICHGIPGDRALKDGDIVNIDVTPILDGWHGDTSRMFLVGEVGIKAKRLVEVTYEAMMRGIAQAKPGNRMGDVAHAIQSYAESHRYSVVRDFCGHGLGRVFHDAPEVVHAGRPGTGPELLPGMFFTIEPMINIGKPAAKVLDDGWTAVTRDRSLSAQFEHSVGITEDGCEIFTKSPRGYDCLVAVAHPAIGHELAQEDDAGEIARRAVDHGHRIDVAQARARRAGHHRVPLVELVGAVLRTVHVDHAAGVVDDRRIGDDPRAANLVQVDALHRLAGHAALEGAGEFRLAILRLGLRDTAEQQGAGKEGDELAHGGPHFRLAPRSGASISQDV